MEMRWERSARYCQYPFQPLLNAFVPHTKYTEDIHHCGGSWLRPQQTWLKVMARQNILNQIVR